MEGDKMLKFSTSDGKEFEVSWKIVNMIKVQLPDVEVINLKNISSFSFEQFLRYCQGHNFEPCSEEIKRPLNDDISLCIENSFDLQFINELGMEEVIKLLTEITQLNCSGFNELCLSRLALIIRSKIRLSYLDSKLEDLMKIFKVGSAEFNENVISKIISDNGSLMAIDDDRVKELLNDDI